MVVDQIGSGMSTSPHHGLRGAFPRVRIGDDVRAQDRLLRERFGIEELQLVVGGSMGGQQTYDWAVRFPDRVRRAAPLAANARTPAFNAIFVDAICDELTTDPAFADGAYDHGAMAGACPPRPAGRAHGLLHRVLAHRALASARVRIARTRSSAGSWSPTSRRWTPTT